jgi:hypothetical protein
MVNSRCILGLPDAAVRHCAGTVNYTDQDRLLAHAAFCVSALQRRAVLGDGRLQFVHSVRACAS